MLVSRKVLRTQRRAFTLLEMMLVVLVMGILGTVAVFGAKSVLNNSRTQRTINDLRTIKAAIDLYEGKHGEYPATLLVLTQGLNPLLEKVNKDGWQHEYQYIYPGGSGDPNHAFDLFSLGSKVADDADNISVWTMDTIQ